MNCGIENCVLLARLTRNWYAIYQIEKKNYGCNKHHNINRLQKILQGNIDEFSNYL